MNTITDNIPNVSIQSGFPFTFEILGENNWQDTEIIFEATELAAAAKVRAAHPNVISIRRLYD